MTAILTVTASTVIMTSVTSVEGDRGARPGLLSVLHQRAQGEDGAGHLEALFDVVLDRVGHVALAVMVGDLAADDLEHHRPTEEDHGGQRQAAHGVAGKGAE